MGLLSLFSKAAESPPDANSADPVAQARVRARRRLIGAALLVGAGIVAFPLVFETQPRPIPVDLPIVIPRKEAVAPLTPPKPRHAAPAPTESAEPPVAAPPAGGGAAVITETPADAGREVAPARPAEKAEAKPEPKPEPKPESKPEPKAEARPAVPKSAPKPEDAARAKALLEGKAGGRTVVQVGAYADANAARDVRRRVERLGLETYTQVVETSDGKRIRVRVGPFATRDEADKAMAKLKSAGLAATVLNL